MPTHLPKVAREGHGALEHVRAELYPFELDDALRGVSWISQLFGRVTDDGTTDGAVVK